MCLFKYSTHTQTHPTPTYTRIYNTYVCTYIVNLCMMWVTQEEEVVEEDKETEAEEPSL